MTRSGPHPLVLPVSHALLALLAPLALVVLLPLSLAPTAAAHGDAEASELEVEVLADEGNDLNDLRGGWDVTQVFVGEAHDHEVAQGPDGDLVYLRAELYGIAPGESPLSAGTWRAEFSFETPNGTIVRSISTTDGEAFETDFDDLRVNASDGITHVTRASILLGPAGLSLGDVLAGFRVATFVDDQPRDVAPGGLPVAGPAEVPMGDAAASAEYTLVGPTRYAAASLGEVEGTPALLVQSLLKMGSQHVHVALPAGLRSLDPVETTVGPGATASFRLDEASIPDAGATFDVTTDIGGRVTVTLASVGGETVLVPEGADVPASPTPAETSLGAAVAIVALALASACVALVRRR